MGLSSLTICSLEPEGGACPSWASHACEDLVSEVVSAAFWQVYRFPRHRCRSVTSSEAPLFQPLLGAPTVARSLACRYRGAPLVVVAVVLRAGDQTGLDNPSNHRQCGPLAVAVRDKTGLCTLPGRHYHQCAVLVVTVWGKTEVRTLPDHHHHQCALPDFSLEVSYGCRRHTVARKRVDRYRLPSMRF